MDMVRALFIGLSFAASLASLSGCKTIPRDRVITVRVTAYVPIPAALTSHPALPEPNGSTCGAAVEVARARKDVLRTLYAQLDAIKGIEGTKIGEAECLSVVPASPGTVAIPASERPANPTADR
jgi:hypothetical protein